MGGLRGREVGDCCRRIIGEHIDVEMLRTEDIPMVKADISQVNQILLNLVVNAREAMPDGGKITIETALVSSRKGGLQPAPFALSVQFEDGLKSALLFLLNENHRGFGAARDM